MFGFFKKKPVEQQAELSAEETQAALEEMAEANELLAKFGSVFDLLDYNVSAFVCRDKKKAVLFMAPCYLTISDNVPAFLAMVDIVEAKQEKELGQQLLNMVKE